MGDKCKKRKPKFKLALDEGFVYRVTADAPGGRVSRIVILPNFIRSAKLFNKPRAMERFRQKLCERVMRRGLCVQSLKNVRVEFLERSGFYVRTYRDFTYEDKEHVEET